MAVARVTEIVSGSPTSFDDALRKGLERATKTLKNVQQAWVKDQYVVTDDNGTIREYRMNLKITFVLED